jgi:hypothetical protein
LIQLDTFESGADARLVTEPTGPQHHWPEEEEPRPRPAKRGVLAWIGRFIGDASLTIGMGQSFDAGGVVRTAARSTT